MIELGERERKLMERRELQVTRQPALVRLWRINYGTGQKLVMRSHGKHSEIRRQLVRKGYNHTERPDQQPLSFERVWTVSPLDGVEFVYRSIHVARGVKRGLEYHYVRHVMLPTEYRK